MGAIARKYKSRQVCHSVDALVGISFGTQFRFWSSHSWNNLPYLACVASRYPEAILPSKKGPHIYTQSVHLLVLGRTKPPV